MSPFPYFKAPKTRLEAQSNANHFWWELMGARDALREADAAGDRDGGVLASRDVKAWEVMHREAQREARRFGK